jgi:hypothetical protein
VFDTIVTFAAESSRLNGVKGTHFLAIFNMCE